MTIVINIALLLVGFVLLIKGADFFVDGACALARKLRIPPLVVGLTIVAMGTSAPELAVSISASVSGANSMAVSNVIGSNLFNLLAVLGVCSAIIPSMVTKALLRRDYPVSIAVSAVFLVMLFIGGTGVLTRIEAGILVVMLAGYMVWTVVSAMKNPSPKPEDDKPFVWWKCALFIVGGAAAIVFGGNFVVDNASAIGAAVGMSETLIGLTICAVGTSLPELVTSITAARKGENDVAMGNVIGSNIFNVLMILGVSGLISPITIDAASAVNTLTDCVVYIAVCLLAYVFCITGKKVTRVEGGLLVFMYVCYMAFAILREYVF
ncbi:MAG: calcium/sodium antiporter [Oscillospiraceae bacterium]